MALALYIATVPFSVQCSQAEVGKIAVLTLL